MGLPRMNPQTLAMVPWRDVRRLCRWAGVSLPRMRARDTLQQHFNRLLQVAVEGLERHRDPCNQHPPR